MKHALAAIGAVLTVLAIILLNSCGEQDSPQPEPPVQYDNSHETTQETTTGQPSHHVQYSNEHIQYGPTKLPDTGGLKL